MSWTYSSSQLNLPLYQVRLMIGDVMSCDPQLQDEEILYFISTRTTNYGAAAECCRSLATRMSRSFDQQAAGSKVYYSQMEKAYIDKAIKYEILAIQIGSATPYFGAVSLTDKENQEADFDRPEPMFELGMDDNYLPVPPVKGVGPSDD